jgi:hypothetical protein
MGLTVCRRTEQWRLPHNCFYDLLRTYHRATYGFGAVSMAVPVCWPGLWSRKNLCFFVGTGSLLVHNTLKRNIKKITRSKHHFSPQKAKGFRIQDIQVHSAATDIEYRVTIKQIDTFNVILKRNY